MLTIRYLRSGRANKASFRVVLTEKSKPCDSGFIKVLGWYNPHTKEVSLDNEAILSWVDKGASVSNSVAKLLIANGVKHKNIKFVPDAPKEKKGKKDESEKPQPQPQPEADSPMAKEADTENADLPADKKIEDQPKSDEPPAQKTDEKEKTPDKGPKGTEKEQPAEKPKSDESENISKPEGTKEKK